MGKGNGQEGLLKEIGIKKEKEKIAPNKEQMWLECKKSGKEIQFKLIQKYEIYFSLKANKTAQLVVFNN